MADEPQAAPPPLTEDGLVRAYSPGGEKIRIAPGEVARLQQAGGRLASDEELATIRLDQMDAEKLEHRKGMGVGDLVGEVTRDAVGKVGTQLGAAIGGGGVGGFVAGTLGSENRAVQAFGEGANDAATLGVGKLVEKGIVGATGGDVKALQERRALLERSEGGARMLGQIGGTITQSIASGGALGAANKAGKAAVALDAVGSAGGAAEAAVAKAMAQVAAKGALGRAASSAVSMGVRGAVEGGLQAGAQEVTDAMFADQDLAGEKVLAAMGHGALFGGLTGAGLGFAGSLGKSAAGGLASRFLRAEEQTGLAAVEGAEKLAGKGGAERFLADQSSEAGVRALGGTRTNIKKLTRELGDEGYKDLGEWVQREVLAPAVKEQGLVRGVMDSTPEAMLPKVQERLRETGAKIGEALEKSGATVKYSELMADAEKHMQSLGKTVDGVKAQRAVETTMRDFTQSLENAGLIPPPKLDASGIPIGRADADIPLAELARQRQGLATLAYESGAGGASGTKEALKKWERTIEDRIVAGVPDSVEYKALKRDYQLASKARDVLETGVERARGNNRFGLIDSIGAAAGLAGGGVVGGLAAGAASKVFRKYGDATAAVLLARAARNGSVLNAVQKMDRAVAGAAKGVVRAGESSMARRTVVRAAEDPRPRAASIVARVAAIQSDPVGYADRVQAQSKAMADAPLIGKSHDAGAMRAAAFLASKLPAPRAIDPLRPDRHRELTKQEAAQVVRYADLVKDPTIAFDDMARGHVNREAIEVMKAVYPKMYGQLQQQTLVHLTNAIEKGDPMPYSTRVRIGVVLGMTTDASMRPESVRALQANLATAVPEPKSGPSRPLSSGAKSSDASSAMDRLQ